MGRGVDGPSQQFDALRGVRPEHLHQVAFPLRRPRQLIYWGVEKGSVAIHSQLLNCSESEVQAMVEGAIHHGMEMAVESNYGRTPGVVAVVRDKDGRMPLTRVGMA